MAIYGNTTSTAGGGIMMNIYKSKSLYDNSAFSIQLNGAKVYGNSAANGGAFYATRTAEASGFQCVVDLNYGEFKDNTATSGNGGGAYVNNVSVTIGNTAGTALTITGNKAENGNGGAVYSTGTLGTCTITNGTLTSNKAKNGGAIAINQGTVTISGGSLSQNTATDKGGAVYSWGTGGSCSISNGSVTSNSAKYGGAIAVDDEVLTVNGGSVNSNTASLYGGAIYASGNGGVNVSGNGTISSNKAANGGGIYTTAGADVTVTGGVISNNSATGTTTATTAYSDAAGGGVGGGIYVGNGTSSNTSTVTLSGSTVGLYGNTANFAAADAYASGTYTSVTLPAVKNMNLTGYSGAATGWYEDYATGDTGYANGLKNGTEGERYAKARTTYEVVSATGVTKYTAITLGTSKQGYGNLTIKKTGTGIDPKQLFIFEITGNGLTMQVSVTGTGSVTIYELPDGTYNVREVTSWSWRYTPDNANLSTTISGTNVNPTLSFKNSLTNNNWLSALHNLINVKG